MLIHRNIEFIKGKILLSFALCDLFCCQVLIDIIDLCRNLYRKGSDGIYAYRFNPEMVN